MIWNLIAKLAARPAVADWLIARAKCTPYYPIMSPDGQTVYMDRWWLFNPYGKDADGNPTDARFAWLPSIRLHHIQQPDRDRHLHDHPWNARTIILRGGYVEQRLDDEQDEPHREMPQFWLRTPRAPGDTAAIKFGEYHRIYQLTPGGAWTLFFTWRYRGTWGFLVDGAKVTWREYLAKRDAK